MNLEKTRAKLADIKGVPVAELPETEEALQAACDDAGIVPVNDETDEDNGTDGIKD